MSHEHARRKTDDLPANLLDDSADRDELRRRYYGLLQENRVLLPGVQVLVGFLVTVPFNARFVELDGSGRALWAIALLLGSIAVIVLMAPIVFHRVGGRRRRSVRLTWAIRMQRIGILCIALSLLAAIMVVAGFVLDGIAAATIGIGVLVAIVLSWAVIPMRG